MNSDRGSSQVTPLLMKLLKVWKIKIIFFCCHIQYNAHPPDHVCQFFSHVCFYSNQSNPVLCKIRPGIIAHTIHYMYRGVWSTGKNCKDWSVTLSMKSVKSYNTFLKPYEITVHKCLYSLMITFKPLQCYQHVVSQNIIKPQFVYSPFICQVAHAK